MNVTIVHNGENVDIATLPEVSVQALASMATTRSAPPAASVGITTVMCSGGGAEAIASTALSAAPRPVNLRRDATSTGYMLVSAR